MADRYDSTIKSLADKISMLDRYVRLKVMGNDPSTNYGLPTLAVQQQGGPAVKFETNGVLNIIQYLLNLIAGTGITLTADSAGGVTIASTANSLFIETPAGAMNGSNVTFTLSFPVVGNILFLLLNGVYQQPTTNYTIASTTITFVVAPKASDYALIAIYAK